MTPAPAPEPPPESTGCPPDWGAFQACASSAYWIQAIPFAGPMLHNCLTNPSDADKGAFGGNPSPLTAVQGMQQELTALNLQWAQAVSQLQNNDLVNLTAIFTQLSGATSALQTSIDAAFTPARHLVAYLTVTIFFLGVIVAAAAWAV